MKRIPLLARCIIAGCLSTLTMDVGSTLSRWIGFTAGLQPPLVGRWFASLAQGRSISGTIDAMPPVSGEIAIAALGHYTIGITLTIVFLGVLTLLKLRHRPMTAFALALVFGVITNLMPWLWMFPAMGYGVFGLSGPGEWMLLRSSLVSHVFFGLGIALSTRWLRIVTSSHCSRDMAPRELRDERRQSLMHRA